MSLVDGACLLTGPKGRTIRKVVVGGGGGGGGGGVKEERLVIDEWSTEEEIED